MNRKELACAAAGAVLGAAGCSAPVKQLVVPDAMANAEPASAVPYIKRVRFRLPKGADFVAHLEPSESAWKVTTSNDEVLNPQGSNNDVLIVFAVDVGDAIVTVTPPNGGPSTEFHVIVG